MAVKPRIFVASSSQRMGLAHAVQANLQKDASVTVWDQGVFSLSQIALDSLLRALEQNDFGVFIFSPDDAVIPNAANGQENKNSLFTVRDNVLFEVGLFAGRLGRERIFLLAPRPSETEVRIASDLSGITLGYFDPDSELAPEAIVGPCCNEVRKLLQAGRRAGLVPSRHLEACAALNKELLRSIDGDVQTRGTRELCERCLEVFQEWLYQMFPSRDVIASLMWLDQEDIHSNSKGQPTATQFECRFTAGVAEHPEMYGWGTDGRPKVSIKGSLAGEALQSKRMVFIEDIAKASNRFAPELYEKIKDHIAAAVAWPLFLNGQVVAVLKIDARTRGLLNCHNEALMHLMTCVASKLEVTLRVAAMRRQADLPAMNSRSWTNKHKGRPIPKKKTRIK